MTTSELLSAVKDFQKQHLIDRSLPVDQATKEELEALYRRGCSRKFYVMKRGKKDYFLTAQGKWSTVCTKAHHFNTRKEAYEAIPIGETAAICIY